MFAVISRSGGFQSFLTCARNLYAEKSLARFSTAIPERTYRDHDYYPFSNTHFADSSADMRPTSGQLETVWNSKTILLLWTKDTPIPVYLLYRNWRLQLDR
jgi:hypothetical protein